MTTLEGAPLREARFFCDALTERNFHLGALILNKTLPAYLRGIDGRRAAEVILEDVPRIADALAALGVPALDDREATGRVLTTAATTYCDYAVVAAREAELHDEMSKLPDVVITVPGLEDDIHDLAGLRCVADRLFAQS